MTSPLRVGIIGTGFGAKVHTPNLKAHPRYEVTAIASVHRGNVTEITKMTGIEQVYSDWRELLRQEELDLVSVTSAPFLHHDMVIAAFQHGLHVFCEKPMALDASQTAAMIMAKKRSAKQGHIHFEFRFLPARLSVKKLMDEGRIGRLLHAQYRGFVPGAVGRKWRWLDEKAKGGGMLGALGSHMIDSLLWWTASNPSYLQGNLIRHASTIEDDFGRLRERDVDDSFQVIGSLDNGAAFSVELVLPSKHQGWDLALSGTEGTIWMKDDREVWLQHRDGRLEAVKLSSPSVAPPEMAEPASRFYPAMHPYLDALAASIQQGEASSTLATFADGHRVQQVLDAVRLSHETGKRVTF